MGCLPFMGKFPFSINDSEGDVFIWRAGTELQDDGLVVTRLFDDLVCRRFGFVDEIRIKYVELSRRELI